MGASDQIRQKLRVKDESEVTMKVKLESDMSSKASGWTFVIPGSNSKLLKNEPPETIPKVSPIRQEDAKYNKTQYSR